MRERAGTVVAKTPIDKLDSCPLLSRQSGGQASTFSGQASTLPAARGPTDLLHPFIESQEGRDRDFIIKELVRDGRGDRSVNRID